MLSCRRLFVGKRCCPPREHEHVNGVKGVYGRMDRATRVWGIGADVVGLIGRFLDREDIENCLLSCREICDAFM